MARTSHLQRISSFFLHSSVFTCLLVSILAFATPQKTQGQERFLASGTPAELLAGNASFRLTLGRLILDSKRYRVGQFRFKQAVGDIPVDPNVLRTLTISQENGQPNLILHRSTPTQRWHIEAKGNGRTVIHFQDTANGYQLTWDQPAHGLIKVRIESSRIDQTLNGLSLWHIYFADPDLCLNHLFPLISTLEPNLNPELIATETEQRMIDVLQMEPIVSEKQINILLTEFTSNNSSTRDRAHRELRELGLVTLTPLMMSDLDKMEPEQNRRIERLIQTMRPTTDDTPNRLAAWLAGDYNVCQLIAARMEGDKKEHGLAYLKNLSGPPPTTSIIR